MASVREDFSAKELTQLPQLNVRPELLRWLLLGNWNQVDEQEQEVKPASERTNEGESDGFLYRDNELGFLPDRRSEQHWRNPFSILPGQRTSSPQPTLAQCKLCEAFELPANLSQCLWPSVNFINDICAFDLLLRDGPTSVGLEIAEATEV